MSDFTPIFEKISVAARVHEAGRSQPYDEVGLLKDAGFGALRISQAEGGGGLTIEQLFELLLELGAADSNLPQIWRNHFAFVEDKLQGPQDQRWRDEVVAGSMFGGAWSEIGGDSLMDLRTVIERRPDGLRLNGTKYYSTGSIFSDWVSVLAKSGPEELSLVLVKSSAPGVRLDEDWTGIGQRQTGSGTATFIDVTVDDANVSPFSERAPYQEAFYQLVHLATLGGIARAAHQDAIAALRNRKRAYPAGLSNVPREDAQNHEVIGRVGALASSIEASVLWAARGLDAVVDAIVIGAEESEVDELIRRATVGVYEAQLTVTDAALEAATIIYDALGSSALDERSQLDRHWRNARTVSSHNPRIIKARIVGDWHLNGTDPIAALWGGAASPAAAEAG